MIIDNHHKFLHKLSITFILLLLLNVFTSCKQRYPFLKKIKVESYSSSLKETNQRQLNFIQQQEILTSESKKNTKVFSTIRELKNESNIGITNSAINSPDTQMFNKKNITRIVATGLTQSKQSNYQLEFKRNDKDTPRKSPKFIFWGLAFLLLSFSIVIYIFFFMEVASIFPLLVLTCSLLVTLSTIFIALAIKRNEKLKVLVYFILALDIIMILFTSLMMVLMVMFPPVE